MRTRIISACFVTALFALTPAAYGQRSTTFSPLVPATAAINSNVNLSAVLVDAWNGGALQGKSVEVTVGDEWSLFGTTTFNSGSTGKVTRTWRFARPGRYRVTFKFNGGAGYLDCRTTVFINVFNRMP